MIVRARWQLAGGHVHVRVFLAKNPHSTAAKCGDLAFQEDEWRDGVWDGLLAAGWEVVPEAPDAGPPEVKVEPAQETD